MNTYKGRLSKKLIEQWRVVALFMAIIGLPIFALAYTYTNTYTVQANGITTGQMIYVVCPNTECTKENNNYYNRNTDAYYSNNSTRTKGPPAWGNEEATVDYQNNYSSGVYRSVRAQGPPAW